MKKVSRRNFLKVSGAMAAAGALAACGGSGASTPAASGAASTSTAASAAAAGEDKFASLGDFTMTVGHAQPEGNPRFVSMEQFAADVAEATNGHVKIEVYGNGSGHGALAGFLMQHGVDTLVCGGIGGGAQAALAEAGIKLYGGVSGDADAAVSALLSGSLGYDPNIHCDHHDHEHGEAGHTCGDHGCGNHSCH